MPSIHGDWLLGHDKEGPAEIGELVENVGPQVA
jgi:hypothetical protein